MSPGVTVHWELLIETQRLLEPVQNRDIARRLAKVLSLFMVAAACQGPEVLTVLPDVASAAVQPWSFRAPTNVVATPMASSRIAVAWQDESPNESGFQVFRSGASVEFTLVGITAADISSWSDSGLLAATQYCYLVRAFRANKSTTTYSTNSNTSCAMTLAPPSPPAPVAPSWVWATPLDSATISIEWRDDALVEDGFRVERSIDGGATWRTAATVASDILSWTGGDPVAEHGPCYRVFAFNESGDSSPSMVRCAVPPAAPSNLAVTMIGSGEIELTWTDNSAVEARYEVWTSNGSYCCPGDGCDAGWYENSVAALPANTTMYRTRLASSACLQIYVFVTAYKLGNHVMSGYALVPPLP